MDFASKFPFKTFRPHQKETLEQIGKLIEEKDYILINAPVGSGKSPMAVAIAAGFNFAHLITTQKTLQDQYIRDFSDVVTIKGKSNYPCKSYPGLWCNKAPCRKDRGLVCFKQRFSDCAFYVQLEKARTAQMTLHNFSSFLYQTAYTKYWDDPRDVMIVDEAHNLENTLMSFVSISIPVKMTSHKIPKSGDLDRYRRLLIDIKTEFEVELDKIRLLIRNEVDPFQLRQLFDDEEKYSKTVERIDFYFSQSNPDDWVVKPLLDKKTNQVRALEVKPIFVREFAQNTIFNYAGKVICMSATINKEEFCRSLGVPEYRTAYLEIPSTFPKENRPIYRSYVGNIGRDTLDEMLPRIARKITNILTQNPDTKGIIHTHTYQITEYIAKNVKSPRLIIQRGSELREGILKEHIESSDPTVLVTPSMTEGVDLKDDIARWQVLCKVPYLNLGDKQVRARLDRDKDWYYWQAIRTVCQAYGRAMRSAEDYADFYILDRNFETLLERYADAFPVWFREALI